VKVLRLGAMVLAGMACALVDCVTPVAADDVTPQLTPQLTRVDLEAWLDGFLPYALAQADIAGAVIVVVRDGQVLLQKGYGYADVAAATPVDPERTLFRVASISKVFTWTAVMQQVERGTLDLDRDVNEYLDFSIPPAFGKPVTLRHLMTHSGGFEETIKSTVSYDPTSPVQSIGPYLKAHVPARIDPPGAASAYSNYGTTLAGYIVERVSGEPYLDYIERHVLQPLDMHHSTFRQPLPAQLQQQLSNGYLTGSHPAQSFEGIAAVPAGGLTTTGPDMAHFMIAHLQNGRYLDRQLLKPETARLMHAPAFNSVPGINGNALGFFRLDRDGRRIIGHSGDTGLFHSDLRLYLDDGVGLFVSMNSSGKDLAAVAIRAELFERFTHRYFPAAAPQEPTAATAAEHGRLLEGSYEMSRGFRTSFMAAPELFQQTGVSANRDGTLSVSGFAFRSLNGQPKVWREVAPFIWRERDGRQRLAAKIQDGRVIAMSTDEYAGIMIWRPVSAWRSATWNLPLLIGSAGVLVVTVFGWAVSAWRKRPYASTRHEVLAHRLTRIAAAVNLTFLVGWVLVIVGGSSNRQLFDFGLDPWLRALQLFGLVGALGAVAALWHAWIVWKEQRGAIARTWALTVAIASLSIAWFGVAFRLLAPGVNY
jgi:CubicO group peptidase (beta-lactamase class C family)